MPTRISVQIRGMTHGEHLVTDEVIRIGSDSNCNVVIPGQPAHLLTLRFDGGRYTVFNRSGRQLRMESQKLDVNGSSPWGNGEDLFLDDDLILTLMIDGNPEPVRRKSIATSSVPTDLQVDEPDAPAEVPADDETETKSSPGASSTTVQIAVIVVCLILFAALMLVDQSGNAQHSTRSAATIRHEFAECMAGLKKLSEESPALASEAESYRVMLQDARIEELRRADRGKTINLYGGLMKKISDQYRKPDQGDFPEDDFGRVVSQIYDFSRNQLALISSN